MSPTAVLPDAVWRWVDQLVPTSDRAVHLVAGGFAVDGVRGRIATREGPRFLKARRTTDPDVRDEAIEAAVLGVLPERVGAPRLVGAGTAGDWHVTVTEFVEGVLPLEPMPVEQLDQVLGHVGRMSDALSAIAPPPGIPSVLDRMRGRAETWTRLRRFGRTRHLTVQALSQWERANLDRLSEDESRFAEWPPGGQLLHFDLRYDNLLLTEDGAVRVLDWGRSCLGPAWVDPVCLLLESRHEAQDLDAVFADSTRGDPPAASDVDAFLSMLAGYWREAAEDASASASLTRRRRASLRATEAWLASRWA